MKYCPRCGRKFNWWQRSVGEAKEHVRHCCGSNGQKDELTLAAACRGCPAGCFEDVYQKKEK